MNDVSQNKKDSVLKSLAIAGFIGIIILIAWLSIQLVGVVPGAFSSLASIAESLNQYESGINDDDKIVPITVTSNTTLAKAGESVELSWATSGISGSYTFSYQCTDGVAVDVNNVEGVQSIACDTNYNIGNIDSLSLTIDSEKERYADMNYTISFLGTNDTEPRGSGTSSITVVNGEIPTVIATNVTDVDIVQNEDTPSESEPVVDTPTEEVPEVVNPIVSTPEVATPPVPTKPVYKQEYVYTIPVSDPNGRTDISTKFLNTGTIVSNVFLPGTIKQSGNGAFQFEVKNLGTKTSGDWTFSVSLPGGNTYNSPVQKPLKPNERAVLTIGFSTANDKNYTFVVKANEKTDYYSLNDSFSQTVTFIK